MSKKSFIVVVMVTIFSSWMFSATYNVTLSNLVYKIDSNNDQILQDTNIVICNPNNVNITLTITSYHNNGTKASQSTFSIKPCYSEYHTLTEKSGFGESKKNPLALQIPTLFPYPFEGYAEITGGQIFQAYSCHGNWQYAGPVGGDERIRNQHPEWSKPCLVWYEVDLSLPFYTTYVAQINGKTVNQNCYLLPWLDIWTQCLPGDHPGWDVTVKLLNYTYQYQVPKIRFWWVTGGTGDSNWYDMGLLPPAQNTPYGFRPGQLTASLTEILSDTGFWGDGQTQFCSDQKHFGGIAFIPTFNGLMLASQIIFSLPVDPNATTCE